ncbi:xylanase [Persicobacter diffluens]|uniref:Xylanase n=2 Tax=Persicobacter diffluens TaxID=981 RepID=A0AAN4W4H3_9BACT|nr:xylanase [Persicobacter diffluens]
MANKDNDRHQIIPLYDGVPPNSLHDIREEKQDFSDNILKISHVTRPTIEVFLPTPEIATGEAVVICPGGGYWILAYDLEGTEVAKMFNEQGIAAIVLKYRLPTSHESKVRHESALMDAQRAIRMVRKNAIQWGIDQQKIGVMGFSAGGHLASSVSVQYDLGKANDEDPVERFSCRPDFSLLIYPVISFEGEFVHKGSRQALLGEHISSPSLRRRFSAERHVDRLTPPSFLVHSIDDDGVPCENSMFYFNACRAAGVKTELHLFPMGGHGYGLGKKFEGLREWPQLAVTFIRQLEGI